MADEKDSGAPGSSSSRGDSVPMQEEDTLTFADIMEANKEMEDLATAVLGGSDNENCSYSKGYVKRQALYACLTCNNPKSPDFKPAGVCLACSLKCHSGHDMVELYTKRNFRCDCGNSKFLENRCSLVPIKDEVNDKNEYNHNFTGVYCLCRRPYPDPEEDEDEDEDEMIQCVLCEDWLHGRHINNDEIDTETEVDEADFICESCAKKNPFLGSYYGKLKLQGKSANTETVTNTGILSDISDPDAAKVCNKLQVAADDSSSHDSGVSTSSIDDGTTGTDCQPRGTKRLHPGEEPSCLLETEFTARVEFNTGTWWKKNWRLSLCRCSKCCKLYEDHKVLFLLDSEDLLEAYEAKGRENAVTSEQIEQKMVESALNRLDHVGKMEFLHSVNEMKDGLVEYFDNIVKSGRTVITEKDVTDYFEQLRAKRRRFQ